MAAPELSGTPRLIRRWRSSRRQGLENLERFLRQSPTDRLRRTGQKLRPEDLVLPPKLPGPQADTSLPQRWHFSTPRSFFPASVTRRLRARPCSPRATHPLSSSVRTNPRTVLVELTPNLSRISSKLGETPVRLCSWMKRRTLSCFLVGNGFETAKARLP